MRSSAAEAVHPGCATHLHAARPRSVPVTGADPGPTPTPTPPQVSCHRYHHLHCETPLDPHSVYEGFWWSHMGWLLDDQATQSRVFDTSNAKGARSCCLMASHASPGADWERCMWLAKLQV